MERKKNQISFAHKKLKNSNYLYIKKNTKILNLTDNLFINFDGIDFPDTLEELILDKNPIISFRNFPELPKLKSLSLVNTPISKLQNFRTFALIVTGETLKFLNGEVVTSKDLLNAREFGSGDTNVSDIRNLLIKGFIPKSSNINRKSIQTHLQQVTEAQKNDPPSVQITRFLRFLGYDNTNIRFYLREYFSPYLRTKSHNKPPKTKNKLMIQYERQQEIIDTLAVQLQSLYSGDEIMSEYERMVSIDGKELIENAEILRKMETKNETNEEEEEINENDYYEMRNALMELLDMERGASDVEIIQKLNEMKNKKIDSGEENYNGEEEELKMENFAFETESIDLVSNDSEKNESIDSIDENILAITNNLGYI